VAAPSGCEISIDPKHVPENIQRTVRLEGANCIADGDVAIFLRKGSPDDGSCNGAAAAAGGTANGGTVAALSVKVSLPAGKYKLCVAKATALPALTDDEFALVEDVTLYSDDNIRTRPFEPNVKPKPDSHEDGDCTLSRIFCKYNHSESNTTSTPEAGQIETSHEHENATSARKRRWAHFGGAGDINDESDKSHGWGAINWDDFDPPSPPPPPLSPGQSWQDHECDMASWLCPKNRTRNGRSATGPGGISRWKTAIDGEPKEYKFHWWWVLVVLLILLLCCCCVLCFLACQRSSLVPTPGLADVASLGSGPISIARVPSRAKLEPAAAATQT
jgi:hypothetical protein